MKLIERAKLLRALGFLPADADLKALVKAAEEGPYEIVDGPATAILHAAGRVLEIMPDEAAEPEHIPAILQRIQAFCGNIFKITNVETKFIGSETLQIISDEDDEEGESDTEADMFLVSFQIDGHPVECEIIRVDDTFALGFLADIDDHLDRLGEKRRLCPLVEIMDETGRYLFIEQAKMDEAELREIISAPDFGDGEEW